MIFRLIFGGLLLAAPARAEGVQAVPEAFAAPILSGDSVITTVSHHPNPAFPLGVKSLRVLAARLADLANEEAKQDQVGDLVSYVCQAAQGARAAYCDLKYGLPRDYCWYGYQHIRVILEISAPHRVFWKDLSWQKS